MISQANPRLHSRLRRLVTICLYTCAAETAAAQQLDFLLDFSILGGGGIAVDNNSGNIFVSGKPLQAYDNEGNFLFEFGGETNRPFDLAVSPSGNIHVADHWDGRVYVFDPAGTFQFQFGDLMSTPRTIGVDGAGNTYVDSNAPDFGPSGFFSTSISVFNTDGDFENYLGAPGSFNRPHGIAFDRDGNVYVADGGVKVLDSAGNYDFSFSTNGAAGVAVDSRGNIYVTGYSLQVFDSAGLLRYEVDTRFDSVAIDSNDRLYATIHGRSSVSVWQIVHVEGDFNGDGAVTVDDLDLLTEEVHNPAPRGWFDLNGDQIVNHEDRVSWVREVRNVWFGDANLDGEFNSLDLTEVLRVGKYLRDVKAGWSEGDWTGDGRFDRGDILLALQDGGYGHGGLASVNAVPEPSCAVLLLIGAIGILRMRRLR